MTEFPFLGDLKDETEIKGETYMNLLVIAFIFCILGNVTLLYFGVFVKEEVRKCFQLPLRKLLLDLSQGSTVFKFGQEWNRDREGQKYSVFNVV